MLFRSIQRKNINLRITRKKNDEGPLKRCEVEEMYGQPQGEKRSFNPGPNRKTFTRRCTLRLSMGWMPASTAGKSSEHSVQFSSVQLLSRV